MLKLNEQQKTSYALGRMVAAGLRNDGVEKIDAEYIGKAFADVFNDAPSLFDEAELQDLLDKLIAEMQQKKMEEPKGQHQAHAAEGLAFLESNKNNEGVKTAPSGLQYKVTKEGKGAYPKDSDTVTVHYEGKLINGEIFDSSFQRGQTATFGLNQVIKGWTEGLQYINEGGEIELYIPYNLAYGERGAGGSIPPFATLIFKVQLMNIN
ncbi:MAG: FKBP-type peptidyl-prolyl cis-trans isomerase [Flavobacteriales bacterium]